MSPSSSSGSPGLFIVPRYYIHHQATTPGSAEDRAWIEREDKARTDHPDPGDADRLGCSA